MMMNVTSATEERISPRRSTRSLLATRNGHEHAIKISAAVRRHLGIGVQAADSLW